MITWIKNNKLASFLLLIIAFYLFNNFIQIRELGGLGINKSTRSSITQPSYDNEMMALDSTAVSPIPEVEQVSTSTDRMVIQNSSMSLLVSDVRSVGSKIVNYAENAGGFMVQETYNRPDDSAFGTVTVRVPTSQLNEALDIFRGYAVKVTNENLVGRDVTEQYTDIEARLETLEKTKSKFNEILNKATEIQDILQVNQQIIYIQNQIDSLMGQKEAIENNAAFTKITVYLSSDELSLPYAPDNKFRPNVVFKLAVRSMLGSLIWLGEKTIWLAVYSIIWVPVLIIIFFLNKLIKKRGI